MLHRKGMHVVQKVHVVYVGICCINFKKIVSNEKYFQVVQKLKLVYICVISFARTAQHTGIHFSYVFVNLITKGVHLIKKHPFNPF